MAEILIVKTISIKMISVPGEGLSSPFVCLRKSFHFLHPSLVGIDSLCLIVCNNMSQIVAGITSDIFHRGKESPLIASKFDKFRSV